MSQLGEKLDDIRTLAENNRSFGYSLGFREGAAWYAEHEYVEGLSWFWLGIAWLLGLAVGIAGFALGLTLGVGL